MLLTFLAGDSNSPEHVIDQLGAGTKYRARDVCYADHRQYQDSILRTLQRMVDLESAYSLVFNLNSAFKKRRGLHYYGQAPSLPLEYIVICLAEKSE